MESNQQTEQPATDPQNNADLWVLEGVIDAPLVLPRPGAGPNQGKDVRGFSIDFGSGDGDGFVEFHAADVERANKPEWWSKDAPVLFDFRCSVVAAEPLVAWLRANDFLAQVLDRLTFLTGDPVTLVSRSYLYNETELIECEAGRRSTFRFQTGGIPTSTTGPMRNLHVLARLRPSNRGKLAMRWFRKALTFEKEEDQFLAFFVALEVLSDDIKAAAKISPTCKNCGAPISSFTSHLEGVKDVVNRHSDLPPKMFDRLRKMRGKIAHGELSESLLGDVRDCLPLVEQLAAEAIAISLGADASAVQTRGSRLYDATIFGDINFDPKQNPHSRWGQSIPVAVEHLRSLLQQ